MLKWLLIKAAELFFGKFRCRHRRKCMDSWLISCLSRDSIDLKCKKYRNYLKISHYHSVRKRATKFGHSKARLIN